LADLQLSSEVAKVMKLNKGTVNYAEWSSDGHHLTFAVGDQWREPHEWEWWLWDETTEQSQPLSVPPDLLSVTVRQRLGIGNTPESVCDSSVVSVSPQASQVIYTKLEDPAKEYSYTLWIADLEGLKFRELGTVFSRGCNTIRWSPRGDQAVVATWPEAGEPTYFLVGTADNSYKDLAKDVVRIPSLCQSFFPRFSPDGTMLLYSPRERVAGERCSIEVMDLATGEIHKVADSGRIAGWSADGKSVYVLDKDQLREFRIDAVVPSFSVLAKSISGRIPGMKMGGGNDILLVSFDKTKLAYIGGEMTGAEELRIMRLDQSRAQ
jgi:Tol biopolymer transport system component